MHISTVSTAIVILCCRVHHALTLSTLGLLLQVMQEGLSLDGVAPPLRLRRSTSTVETAADNDVSQHVTNVGWTSTQSDIQWNNILVVVVVVNCLLVCPVCGSLMAKRPPTTITMVGPLGSCYWIRKEWRTSVTCIAPKNKAILFACDIFSYFHKHRAWRRHELSSFNNSTWPPQRRCK